MSTIQELGAFLAREQAAGTTPAPTATPAKAATALANSPSPAGELPATDAGVNTDHNGGPTTRPH